MATQGMLYDVTTLPKTVENVVVVGQTGTARSFYQTDLAMMGTLAIIPNATNLAADTTHPWRGYAD